MSGTIQAFVKDKGITEVLHFTTNHGLLGILASHRVWSRLRLATDDLTSDVQLPVWAVRKDDEWTDYVNLSISEMSYRMFATSQKQHSDDDVWWAVLAFSPDVLSHKGVWFTTTNNTYVPKVRRGEGLEGLMDLWTEPIPWGWYTAQSWRSQAPDNRPTDSQAEVLYPVALSLEYLTCIYVREEEHVDEIEGWKAITGTESVPVIHKPEVFK